MFWFGKDGAGSVQANLDRWGAQIDGKEAKPQSLKMPKGWTATMIEKVGTYVAEISPGSPQRHDKAGYRLLGCVLETPGGPLYARMVGPEKLVDGQRAAFQQWIQSFEELKPKTPAPEKK
jgi:hypothetical protein